MSNNPEDTQFQGFAKALVEEIINQVPATIYPLDIDISDKLEKLIARRAYDFATHVVENVSAYSVPSIPDMTELPKEQER